jgi:predicted RNase H-like HicB family nuclease
MDTLALAHIKAGDVRDILDWSSPQNLYRCHICVTRDEGGVFSAVVLNLPGCGSCGDTQEEALNNVREAARGVIESHTAAGEEIPWVDSTRSEIPTGAHEIWIVVNA